jgi:TusA-related sulfurtransferase
MRRISALAALVVAGVSLSLGCETKPTPAPPVASSSEAASSAAPTASVAAPALSASPLPPLGKMANCPNIVEGATTAIKEVEGGVELTITAKDASATGDIRAKSKRIAEMSKEEVPSVRHDGSHHGGGQFGRCPVVARNTVVTSEEVEGGSRVTVKPKDAAEVDWVRREARERQAELGQPGGKDAGGGKMVHCPSAVPGAATAVKDTKDAVLVTVTARDEAAVTDIRARTRHIVDSAKKDPKDVKHDGQGDGGGALGRCPVVLKDTTVTAKDVPGGSELTVKPAKPADVAGLLKEAKDRAEAFSPGAAVDPKKPAK